MPSAFRNFTSIWCIVFVAEVRPGERITPITLAAMDLAGALVLQIGRPKLQAIRRPPYPTGPQTLIVTVDAQQLAGCHLALGWRLPERIIDLLIEQRNQRRTERNPVGGLAGALIAVGELAAAGLIAGTSPAEMRHRLGAVARLFHGMRGSLDVGRALLRGRYLSSVAHMEATGIPLDRALLARLNVSWSGTLDHIIRAIDVNFGVYSGRRLDVPAFVAMLNQHHIDWPRQATGVLDLSDETFREMARLHPMLCPLKDLRSTLVGFDPRALAVGRDGRNRVPLRPFASSTGRNQPSAKASVLGSAAWVRHLIRPDPGKSLALVDWEQQEFGIAAALSGDPAMQAAYSTGDPYLALARAARAIPEGATPASHASVRERFKRCALGLQYGAGRSRLARQLGTTEGIAGSMIASHKAAFPRLWTWLDAVETQALIDHEVRSVFGWRLPVTTETNPRSIRNFPMQANGAEMLRLACCLMTEAGIRVCAPNHDAVMIEVPSDHLDETVAEAQRLMAEASAIVLDGFTLRTSVRTVQGPARWIDPRGQAVWSAVERALGIAAPAHQRDAT
jgi:DNA polymerase-1